MSQRLASAILALARTVTAGMIYVDRNGIAHDDEGNTWQTNLAEGNYHRRDITLPRRGPARRSPGGYGRGRSRQPSKAPAKAVGPWGSSNDREYAVWYKRVGKLALACYLNGNTKAVQWISGLAVISGLTERDLKWIEGLEKRYNSEIRTLPDVAGHWNKHHNAMLVSSRTPSADLKKLEKHFVIGEEVGAFIKLLPKDDSKAVDVGDAKEERKALMDKLVAADPKNRFLVSIRKQVYGWKPLSDRQNTAMRKYLHGKGMREEMGLFA